MYLTTRGFGFPVMVGLALAVSGCGGAVDKGPDLLVPVSGTMTIDGEPAGGAALSFAPDAGTPGTGGFAATDAQGLFTVQHRSGRDGIEPGKYRITVSRVLKPDGSPVPAGESAMDHNAEETMPVEYTDPAQTPLRVEVSEQMEPLSLEVSTR